MPRLRCYARTLLLALAVGSVPCFAAAATSGSFSITVTIPPIAAGLQAVSQGAVGLSTLDQPGGGLLVATPDQVSQGSSGKFEVFGLDGTPVTARVADSGPAGTPSKLATVSQTATTQLNGMVQTSFSVTPSGAIGTPSPEEPVISVVVSTL